MALTNKVATRRDHTDMPGAVDPPSGINDPYITEGLDGPEWAEREHDLDYHTDVTIDTPADNEVVQYNAASGLWENNGLPHSETTGITTDDHHAKSHAHDGADGSGTVAHADLTGIATDDHHTRYTDAEAVTAVGSIPSAHSDLTGIGTDDHHTKYTDAEAVTAVGRWIPMVYRPDPVGSPNTWDMLHADDGTPMMTRVEV